MKTNIKPLILALGFGLLLLAPHQARAYYNSTAGKWISRDPVEEDGGQNIYSFGGNDALNALDYLGLEWVLKRDKVLPKALASCDCGDTIADLAAKIGLNSQEYAKWLTPVGGALPASASTPLEQKTTFLVPNTVYAYWAGNLWGFGKYWVGWDDSVWYLKALGFRVVEMDNPSNVKRLALQNLLEASSGSKELHGLYFWGHGIERRGPNPYPSPGLIGASGPALLMYGEISLSYKMALGLVFACDSNTGQPALFSNSQGGIWHGYSGTLYPFDFGGYSVWNFISPGDQGTRNPFE
jgi:hypothetical protein